MSQQSPQCLPHLPPQQPKPKKKWPWVVGGFAALVVVSGIAGGTSDEPPAAAEPVVETTTSEPTPEPEPTTEDPEPEPTTEEPEPEPTTEEPAEEDWGSYENTTTLLEITWLITSQDDKDDICWGVDVLGADWAADEFLGATEDDYDRDAVIDFFEEVC